tara:strand:+ start:92 stop:580 length:489 start_codon:yes stop_codon:yes gene_type:complete
LKKSFLEINFDNKNSDLKLLISKKSFTDTSVNITKDVLKKIAIICEREYGVAFNDCYTKLKKTPLHNLIMIENGTLLINQTFEKITNNFLMLTRLNQPIYLMNQLSMKSDTIFTILTPKSFDASIKLRLLSKVSRVLTRTNIKKQITGAKKAEDVLAILMNV